jgi:hypothetical protein
VMEYAGDNLSKYQYLELVDGSSAQELTNKVKSVRGMFSIVWVWSSGSSHYAWLSFQRPMTNVIKNLNNKSKKGLDNGNS